MRPVDNSEQNACMLAVMIPITARYHHERILMRPVAADVAA
jgi:hypothetical protein